MVNYQTMLTTTVHCHRIAPRRALHVLASALDFTDWQSFDLRQKIRLLYVAHRTTSCGKIDWRSSSFARPARYYTLKKKMLLDLKPMIY